MVENGTRERLTGAAILVAVIVLLVPELLSRPRHAALQPVAAVDEAPIRSYTLSLGDGQPSAATTTVSGARPDWPPADGATHAAGAAQAASTAMRTAGDGAKPAAGKSGSAGAAAVATTAGSEAEPAPVGAVASRGAVPSRKSAARGSSAAGSVSAAASVSAVHSASDARGWAVQVGSFSSRENADRLVHRLKLKGYGAFVTESPSRGRNWYRVRVGPERDRAAADATAARLRAAGLRGAVAQPR